MMTFLAGLVVAVFAIVLAPADASAQMQPGPCGASSCLVLAQAGAGQSRQLLLGTRPVPNARKPRGPLNTLNDLSAALGACWVPPPLENAHPGMEITIRFSFNRDGNLMGPLQVTYATPGVTVKTREIYRDALAQSLQSCTPLSFTSGLAGAIAGRPMTLFIVDDRDDSGIKPRV